MSSEIKKIRAGLERWSKADAAHHAPDRSPVAYFGELSNA